MGDWRERKLPHKQQNWNAISYQKVSQNFVEFPRFLYEVCLHTKNDIITNLEVLVV